MEAGTTNPLREDVPAPSVPRLWAIACVCAALASSAAVVAHKADAAATPDVDTPVLAQILTPPVPSHRVALDEQSDVDTEAGPVIPPRLLAALRRARTAGDLDLFEDVALEVAYHLVR